MPVDIDPAQVPVLVVYNMDPAWDMQDRQEVASVSDRLGRAIAEVGYPTSLIPVESECIAEHLDPYSPLEHIVLNWCEGVPGVPHSEWMAADVMDRQGFVFTGAGASTLRLSQNKYFVKRILDLSGIPTPEWRLYTRPDSDGWNRFPAIVKPMSEHCSEGITRDSVVTNQDDLMRRITYILDAYQQPAIVEYFIDGREFHVSLWGNGKLEMLPPAEMDFSVFQDIHDRLCTFEAKFVPGSDPYEKIRTLLPAPLSREELQQLKRVCSEAYQAIGCRDYARIDVRYQDGSFFVLDVNPNADISDDASMACAADLAGFSYGEMGSRLIRLAARRHPIWGESRRTG
ncbi:MAG: D-alanine--D-alanine ligase family protein [Desulfomonilia bacterium]